MPEATEQAPAELGPPVDVVPASSDTPISARDAAAALSQYRWKRDAREERGEAPSETNDKFRAALAGREPESPADQPTEAPAEQPTEAAEPAEELPPIEPPRSWSKEEKEEFNSYPRELQERLARREQERDAGLRRGQNEAAEQRKAIEAERTQLEQARKQYEEALPQLLAMFQQGQQGEFADIKTHADVENLARTDWARYIQYDAHLKKVSAIQQEIQAAEARRQKEFETATAKFADEHNAKFIDAHPELANPAAAQKVRDSAVSYLKDVGFTEKEIDQFRVMDHRLQKVFYDATRYHQAKTAVPKAKAPAPAAKVQKPGTPAERMSDTDANLKSLDNKLDSSGKWKDGAELLIARRAGRR